jgi:hypothetical protein
MIVECASCDDPLFPFMPRCKCGADNPSYDARRSHGVLETGLDSLEVASLLGLVVGEG